MKTLSPQPHHVHDIKINSFLVHHFFSFTNPQTKYHLISFFSYYVILLAKALVNFFKFLSNLLTIKIHTNTCIIILSIHFIAVTVTLFIFSISSLLVACLNPLHIEARGLRSSVFHSKITYLDLT